MKKKIMIQVCIITAAALLVGAGIGLYFGVYARDFKATPGDIPPAVYPRQFL